MLRTAREHVFLGVRWWCPKLLLMLPITVMSEGRPPSQGNSTSIVGLPFRMGEGGRSYFFHQCSECQEHHSCHIMGHCSAARFLLLCTRLRVQVASMPFSLFNPMELPSFNQAALAEQHQDLTSETESRLRVKCEHVSNCEYAVLVWLMILLSWSIQDSIPLGWILPSSRHSVMRGKEKDQQKGFSFSQFAGDQR